MPASPSPPGPNLEPVEASPCVAVEVVGAGERVRPGIEGEGVTPGGGGGEARAERAPNAAVRAGLGVEPGQAGLRP